MAEYETSSPDEEDTSEDFEVIASSIKTFKNVLHVHVYCVAIKLHVHVYIHAQLKLVPILVCSSFSLQERLSALKAKWKAALKRNKKLLLKCPNYDVRQSTSLTSFQIFTSSSLLPPPHP